MRRIRLLEFIVTREAVAMPSQLVKRLHLFSL